MTNINQIIQDILPPYSPGAIYYELKLLQRDGLIKINQNKSIEITAEGLDFLHSQLLEHPLPPPLLSRLVRILALLLLSDEAKRSTGLRKIQIEMIKNNHYLPKNEQSDYTKRRELKNKLLIMSEHLHKAVLSFIAQI
jgi:DNA-binding PadR family transcriptional regulator